MARFASEADDVFTQNKTHHHGHNAASSASITKGVLLGQAMGGGGGGVSGGGTGRGRGGIGVSGPSVVLFNGTNAEDKTDPTRVGLKAAEEFGVASPLEVNLVTCKKTKLRHPIWFILEIIAVENSRRSAAVFFISHTCHTPLSTTINHDHDCDVNNDDNDDDDDRGGIPILR